MKIYRERVEECQAGGWEACYTAEMTWALVEYVSALIDYADSAWTLCGDSK